MSTPSQSGTGALSRSLTGLETWTPQRKTKVMSKIAGDISAALMSIGQHIEVGNLNAANTKPLDTLIALIHDADAPRQVLEDRARRLHEQRRLLKEEMRKMIKEAEELVDNHTARMDQITQLRRSQRKELQDMRRENEMLRLLSQRVKEDANEPSNEKVDEPDQSSQEEEALVIEEEAEDADAEWEAEWEDSAGDV